MGNIFTNSQDIGIRVINLPLELLKSMQKIFASILAYIEVSMVVRLNGRERENNVLVIGNWITIIQVGDRNSCYDLSRVREYLAIIFEYLL